MLNSELVCYIDYGENVEQKLKLKLKRTQVAELHVFAREVQQDVLELQVAVHNAALHA